MDRTNAPFAVRGSFAAFPGCAGRGDTSAIQVDGDGTLRFSDCVSLENLQDDCCLIRIDFVAVITVRLAASRFLLPGTTFQTSAGPASNLSTIRFGHRPIDRAKNRCRLLSRIQIVRDNVNAQIGKFSQSRSLFGEQSPKSRAIFRNNDVDIAASRGVQHGLVARPLRGTAADCGV
ncbi:MAG: hypothetical protein RLN69_10165 [Woeseiaceae bacterium]